MGYTVYKPEETIETRLCDQFNYHSVVFAWFQMAEITRQIQNNNDARQTKDTQSDHQQLPMCISQGSDTLQIHHHHTADFFSSYTNWQMNIASLSKMEVARNNISTKRQ